MTPELFGLHANSDIITNQNIASNLLQVILSVQPRSVDSRHGKSHEDIIEEKADYILERVPDMFDLEEINKQFPTNYNESMNTVFTQEAARYNILLSHMGDDLLKFKDANRGRIVMNEELERMGVSMMNNEVPIQWSEEEGVGFLSIKNLGAWIADLRKRMAFLISWQTEGTPKCFWLSGLFEPQAFLTGIKQN